MLVGLNPVWGDIVGRAYPDVDDVQARLQELAKLPITDWPERYHADFEAKGRVDADGYVHLVADPGKVLVRRSPAATAPSTPTPCTPGAPTKAMTHAVRA